MSDSTNTVRPTKKQRDLLTYIEKFIGEHGYSPSYREIMNGLNYTSVATVALHVNSLISRGHLRKRDRSARSLEVVSPGKEPAAAAHTAATRPAEEKWLVTRVEQMFTAYEQGDATVHADVAKLVVMVSALRLLGLETAATSFNARLSDIQARVDNPAAPDLTGQDA